MSGRFKGGKNESRRLKGGENEEHDVRERNGRAEGVARAPGALARAAYAPITAQAGWVAKQDSAGPAAPETKPVCCPRSAMR